MVEFEILSGIEDIETIATGRGVYIRRYLQRTYGKGRWRKMKGIGGIWGHHTSYFIDTRH